MSKSGPSPIRVAVLWISIVASLATAHAEKAFEIRVLDAETGRGIPLVELTTVNHLTYVPDNAGVVAFDEPGLLGQRTFFHVCSHG
jgi:hypothetical protein